MSDSINRTPGISSPALGPASSGGIDRHKHDHVTQQTQKHIDPDAQKNQIISNVEELSLSLLALRALISNDFPAEAKLALANFAPLGDLNGAERLCDRVAAKGSDHVVWPNNVTLRQALESAAS